jgi:hypothetical protein
MAPVTAIGMLADTQSRPRFDAFEVATIKPAGDDVANSPSEARSRTI